MPTRTMRRGDTLVFSVQIVKDLTTGILIALQPGEAMPANHVPVNIADWSAWFTMKRSTNDPDIRAVVQVTSLPSGGIVFTQPTLGKLTVTVPALATRGFPDGITTLVSDLQVMSPADVISTPETGTVEVGPDVTNATAAPTIPTVMNSPAVPNGIVVMARAQDISYTPADATKWNNDPPTTVAEALDRIAAQLGPIV